LDQLIIVRCQYRYGWMCEPVFHGARLRSVAVCLHTGGAASPMTQCTRITRPVSLRSRWKDESRCRLLNLHPAVRSRNSAGL